MAGRRPNDADGCGRCGLSAVADLLTRARHRPESRIEVPFRAWRAAAPAQYLAKRLRWWLDDVGTRLAFGRVPSNDDRSRGL